MDFNPIADSAAVAKRLAESGKKVTDVCKHSCPEKLELGNDSGLERRRPVLSRFDRIRSSERR